jgi:hypothetical protein
VLDPIHANSLEHEGTDVISNKLKDTKTLMRPFGITPQSGK